MLERLLGEGEESVVRVYCQPDRPKGRGKKLAPPPVKVLAEARDLPVEQPTKLRDGAVAAQLSEDRVDLAIVVAYGRILPPDVFEAPRLGTWNVHASLLPALRGASPIQHAIIEGLDETGVTLMQLTEGLDEGPMLLARSLPIAPDETAGRLTERVAALGAEVLLEGLRRGRREGLRPEPQDDARASFAPLLDKADGQLDFSRPAEALARLVRGLDPWPGTFVPTPDGPLKVFDASPVDSPAPGARVGTVVALEPLIVQTGRGGLRIGRLQAPGRKPVAAADYLRGAGRHLAIGAPFAGADDA